MSDTNTERDLDSLAVGGDEFLAHYGVKGMKWGVVKSAGSSVASKAKAAGSAVKNITPEQKKGVVQALAITGAAAAASVLAGPTGSILVGGLGKVFTTTTTVNSYATDGQGNSYGDPAVLERLK